MADELDDDFGGFEAADPNETVSVQPQSTPVFLLPTLSNLNLAIDPPLDAKNCLGEDGIPVDVDAPPLNQAPPTSCVSNTSPPSAPAISQIDWNATTDISWSSMKHPVDDEDDISKTSPHVTESSSQRVLIDANISNRQTSRTLFNSTEVTDLRNQIKLAQIGEKTLLEELNLLKAVRTEAEVGHGQQIESLKQNQNSALLLLIERHKADCRRAVTETQERCTAEFRLVIEQAVGKYEASLLTQACRMDEWKISLELENKNKVQEEIARLKDIIQVELNSHKSELESQYNDLTGRMGEEQLKLKNEMNQHIETQKNLMRDQLHAELKEMFDKAGLTQSDNIERSIKNCSDSHQALAMEFWTKTSGETLESVETHIQKALDSYKSAMDQYVEQRIRMDADHRKSQVSAVDVYLETAREHLKSLLLPESTT